MVKHSKLPVIILTGFLGSGKTTLLNRLLAREPRTAVLINEFGSTPVDQQLVERQEIPLLTLSGGCLCCQVRGAFAPVLKNLWMAWSQGEISPFERIIVEASGVASPEPILDTLLRDRWLAARYRLHTVVTTLALTSSPGQLQRFAEARAQVAWADQLVVTHVDLATPADWGRLDVWLQELAPTTPILSSSQGDFEVALLQGRGHEAGGRPLPKGGDLPDHGFRSLCLYLEDQMPWPRLQAVLKELLTRWSEHLVRIKGVVYLPDKAEPVVVHAASGRLYPLVSLPLRSADGRRGRLVFVTAGPLEPLAEELLNALGGNAAQDSLRFQ